MAESQVVVEYLEERYKGQGTQLIPSNPAHAAKVGTMTSMSLPISCAMHQSALPVVYMIQEAC